MRVILASPTDTIRQLSCNERPMAAHAPGATYCGRQRLSDGRFVFRLQGCSCYLLTQGDGMANELVERGWLMRKINASFSARDPSYRATKTRFRDRLEALNIRMKLIEEGG